VISYLNLIQITQDLNDQFQMFQNYA